MFLLALNRSIVFALQSFWRNIWLSLATIFIISLALLSINFLVVINAISDSAVLAVKDRIDISIYLKTDVRESKIAEMKNNLQTLPQVKAVDYKTPADNLDSFKSRHLNDPNIQETLKELSGNPLGATLIVKAKELGDYPEILKAIDDPAYSDLIEEKNYDDHQLVINRINSITNNVKKGGLIVSILFVIIAILIVFNTVRIAIFTHQNEISIMKLVGAGNWFIRVPFIWESILCGLISVALVIGIVYGGLSVIEPYLSGFFAGVPFDLVGYFNGHALLIFGGEILGIVLINIISSTFAIGKYLNV
ncbi:MAG: permease-like cell division protein FtsX [Patescibacteria group bacterium]